MPSTVQHAVKTYRRRLDGLRAIDAAAGDLERRLSDHCRSLFALNAERQRIESGAPSPYQDVKRAIAQRLSEIAVAASPAQAEIDRLSAELSRLQERRGAAARLLARCKEYLAQEHAVSERDLAW
jgi:hypothetical protein